MFLEVTVGANNSSAENTIATIIGTWMLIAIIWKLIQLNNSRRGQREPTSKLLETTQVLALAYIMIIAYRFALHFETDNRFIQEVSALLDRIP